MKKAIYFSLILLMLGCEKNDIQDSSTIVSSIEIPEGHLRIKLSPEAFETINQQRDIKVPQTAETGVISTGIQSIDSLFKEMKIYRMERVFKYIPQFEERTRAAGLHLWFNIYGESQKMTKSHLSEYHNFSDIQHIEPIYQPQLTQSGSSGFGPLFFNEPAENYKRQWYLYNDGTSPWGGIAGADINIFEAWKVTTGSRKVIVAVLDSGIDYNHEDLKDNMWVNTGEIPDNGIDDDENGYIDDVYGYNFVYGSNGIIHPDRHGSSVAGILGAVNNNGKGICGVAGGSGHNDGIRMMSCQIRDGAGIPNIPEAFRYAANNGAVICQNSWVYSQEIFNSEAIKEAIAYFVKYAGTDPKDITGNTQLPDSPMKGGIVFFAAGNQNSDYFFLQGDTNVLTVSNIGPDFKKADDSNYGKWVDFAAPGSFILSTGTDNTYSAGASGTSCACPMVSGVAALVLSAYGKPGYTPQQLKARLLQTSRNIDRYNLHYQGQIGKLINAGAALQSDEATAPLVIANIPDQDLMLPGKETILDLNAFFKDSGNAELNYSATVSKKEIISFGIEKNKLVINPLHPGETNMKVKATNTHGLYTESEFLIKVTLPQNPADDMASYKLYPIPCRDYLKIQANEYMNGEITVQIFTVDGKRVIYENTNIQPLTEKSIQTEKLSAGVYIVTVTYKGSTTRSKIIKQ